MLDFTIRRFAHRGLHGNHKIAPENSLEAFRRAVEHGYGMELDVQLTKDNRIVVFHDDTLDRVCGVSGMIRDYTYNQLQKFTLYDSKERIPLLVDVLRLVDGRTPLIIELKAPKNIYQKKLCQKTAGILDQYLGQYCIESFHPAILFWFRMNRPFVRRGQLCTDFYRTEAKGHRWQFALMETMMLNLITRPDFIAYDIRFMNAPFFRFWRKFITPVGWTVHNKEELARSKPVFDYYIMERVKSS